MAQENPPINSEAQEGTDPAEALSMEQINELLAKEDPRFIEDLSEIGDLKAPEGYKIEPLGLELDLFERSEGDEEVKGQGESLEPPALTRLSSDQIKIWLIYLGGLFPVLLKRAVRGTVIFKNKLKAYFRGLSKGARGALWLMFFSLMSIAGALASLSSWELASFLPEVEIYNLADKADAVYSFSPDEPRESFFSPMRRPDAYILIKGLVVQLRPGAGHPRSQLFVELIIEASSQRAAVEVQKMELRLRDQLARAAEGFTYRQLQTPQGKSELRKALQAQVNTALSTGYVRNVFFQNFLLH